MIQHLNIFPSQPMTRNHDNNPLYDYSLHTCPINIHLHLKYSLENVLIQRVQSVPWNSVNILHTVSPGYLEKYKQQYQVVQQ